MDVEKNNLLRQNQTTLRASIEETHKYLGELGEKTDRRIEALVSAIAKMVDARS